MTALTQYQRLETSALWRDTPEGQRREVVVSLGDATLMITGLSDRPLSHWSLPAIERLNPGVRPAIYAPGETDETLEIADPDMIKAIETVRGAIERARPHPGRLRFGLIGLGLVLIAALAVFWLPTVVMRQTAALLPEAKRMEIGRDLLAEMTMLSGSSCGDATARRALSQLGTRVLGTDALEVVILPQVIAQSSHLPGPMIVVDRVYVENPESAEVLAGVLLAENLRLQGGDPVFELLQEAGLPATLRLLTTGELPPRALRDHAADRLTTPPEPVAQDALLAAFAAAGISSQPYAYALDITGESTIGLIEADPLRDSTTGPLLNDQDWIALQGICGG